MSARCVVTGGTGMVGSHVAEHLVAQGHQVTAVTRPGSDTQFLQSLGVTLAPCGFENAEDLARALNGADQVYHCASRVGDWGPWQIFEQQVVGVARKLRDACAKVGVGRVAHVSSITVYGHPPKGLSTILENETLGRWPVWFDYYARAKAEAEMLWKDYPGEYVILRPSWILGPRDRYPLPRLIRAFRRIYTPLIGNGENLINIIYAGDVAEGIVLAGQTPGVSGEAFHLSSEGEIKAREFADLLAKLIGGKGRTIFLPEWFIWSLASAVEFAGRLTAYPNPPILTRYAVRLMLRPCTFSTAKAAEKLGWRRKVSIPEGLEKSLEWIRRNNG